MQDVKTKAVYYFSANRWLAHDKVGHATMLRNKHYLPSFLPVLSSTPHVRCRSATEKQKFLLLLPWRTPAMLTASRFILPLWPAFGYSTDENSPFYSGFKLWFTQATPVAQVCLHALFMPRCTES